MSQHPADVVVVGSGAGGSAVAGALARQGLAVVVVDAGRSRFGIPGQHARNLSWREPELALFAGQIQTHMVFPDGSDRGPAGFEGLKVSYGVGGMFSLWTSHTPTPHDSELPDCLPAATWHAYLDRARGVLSVDPRPYAKGVRMARILDCLRAGFPDFPGERPIGPMPVAVKRIGDRDHYASSSDLIDCGPSGRPVRILEQHRVLRVVADGARARGVLVADAAGATHVIEAEALVVAAGTVGTPAILAASRIDAGPALGRYVFEHPCIGSRIRLRDEIVADLPSGDPLFSVVLPYGEHRRWQNQICRYPYAASPLPEPCDDALTADIFSFVAQEVQADNCLTFDLDHLDPAGMPRLGGHFALSRSDKSRVAAALAEHSEIATILGTSSAGWTVSLYATGASTHMMGSVRMGATDDGESVCDSTGRLWHYDNLYVAGNGVLSASNAGNPTIVTVAAGLRTADAITAR